MKKPKKQNSDYSLLKKGLKLSAAVTTLGASLGVNTGSLYAAALGIDGINLPAIQSKIDSTQLKFESTQYKEHITLLDSSQIKFDSSLLKFDTTLLKFDLSNYKEDAPFEQTYPELYIFPPDPISRENRFFIPFVFDPSGSPNANFLTFGIESFTYDVTKDGLSIYDVQRSSVPEPSTLLLSGSGIAGLIVMRKLKKSRVS